jgi:hypothetical protein
VVFATKEAQNDLETSTPEASTSPTPARVPHSRDVQAERKAQAKYHIDDPLPEDTVSPLRRPAYIPEGFCEQCFVPLADDPDPETMFIYLHAWKYETNGLGQYGTPLPRWASEHWDGDWKGWADGEVVKPALEMVAQAE